MGVFGGSEDLKRIIELPAHRLEDTPDYTLLLRRPGGTFTLRPEQNAALHQLATYGGLAAEITMGGGKGLICMVAPLLLQKMGRPVKRPLVVVPATLEPTFWREREKFAKHFFMPSNVRVCSYEKLSTDVRYLDSYQPDLILFDEADKLRNAKSARGRRLFTYLHEHPECRVGFLSGTFTRRSIKEYAHLAAYALRQMSFLPTRKAEWTAWADVIDSEASPDTEQFRSFRAVLPQGWEWAKSADNKAAVQNWYRERRRTSPGSVVSHGDDGVAASLLFIERPLAPPSVVTEAIKALATTWCRPDGEELESALEAWATLRRLAVGAYYLWDWPKDEHGNYIKDEEWLEKRATWHRSVRAILKLERKGLDSPLQVTRHIRTEHGAEEFSEAVTAYEGWVSVRDRPKPPTKCVWLDSFALDAACEWVLERIKEGSNGIVWFVHRAVGLALRARGLPVFMDDGDFDSKEPFCAASIAKHGRGKNLQSHCHNLLLELPSTHDVFEQLLARTHRPGQEADEVTVTYFAHTNELKDTLRALYDHAQYVEKSTGKPTRTLRGTWVNPTWRKDDA
jgi:hypothetical protein